MKPRPPGRAAHAIARIGARGGRRIWARHRRAIAVPVRLAATIAWAVIVALAVIVATAIWALVVVLVLALKLAIGAARRLRWQIQRRHASPQARRLATIERDANRRLREIRAALKQPNPAPARRTTTPAPTPVAAAAWPQQLAPVGGPTGQLPPWHNVDTTCTPHQASLQPVVMTAPHYVQVPAPRRHQRQAAGGRRLTGYGWLLAFKAAVIFGLIYVTLIASFISHIADSAADKREAQLTQQGPTP